MEFDQLSNKVIGYEYYSPIVDYLEGKSGNRTILLICIVMVIVAIIGGSCLLMECCIPSEMGI